MGLVMTAAIIAGGSKASVKFFHDILGIKSKALQEKAAVVAGAPTDSVQSPK